jgi:hypothetical protein
MADAPYLVALALLERGGQRALPLTGKSQRPEAASAADPGAEGHTLALELLLRLWQQSSEQPLRRQGTDASLLLLEMPLEAMNERLPKLKAAWIGSGDTGALPSGLNDLAVRGWRLEQARYEALRFVAWP